MPQTPALRKGPHHRGGAAGGGLVTRGGASGSAPEEVVQVLTREDGWTAQLFHRVLGCDVAALLTIDQGAASGWLMTWRERAHLMEHRRPIGGALAATLARSLPPCSEKAVPWPGGLRLVTAHSGGAGMHFELVVPLASGVDRLIVWLLGRAEAKFSPDEVDLVTLLLPGLRRRLGSVATPSPGPASDVLTGRELRVLELVGLGLTSRAVAHRLGISERTVQKHLEHVYVKLGCRDRVSAVLRVRDAGLLPRVPNAMTQMNP
jgi:DNA-binding CsgD family transcriptional regulator